MNAKDAPESGQYKKRMKVMSEKKNYTAPVVASGFWVGFALLMIAFWGEPDLQDALIKYLEAKSYN